MSKLSLDPGARIKQLGNNKEENHSNSKKINASHLPLHITKTGKPIYENHKTDEFDWKSWSRNLKALRFLVYRYSFGFAKKSNTLKLSVVVTLLILILKFTSTTNLVKTNTGIEGFVVETSMELGANTGSKLSKRSYENEAAPVGATELTTAMAKDYIHNFSEIAVNEMNKYGIPASISLAQGLVESRAGTSKLAVRNNNHFGMKCFSRNCKKGHCSNFTDDTHKDFFKKFKTPAESWRAHSMLLASGRYTKLKKYGRDYRKWAYGLKSVGYATDRSYAEKLIGMIERYNLNKYDR